MNFGRAVFTTCAWIVTLFVIMSTLTTENSTGVGIGIVVASIMQGLAAGIKR
jgi:hypothetical protein